MRKSVINVRAVTFPGHGKTLQKLMVKAAIISIDYVKKRL